MSESLPDRSPRSRSATPRKRSRRKRSTDGGPIPVLPIRDQVYYPYGMISILVGRERSIRAVEAAWEADRRIALLTQRAVSTDEPKAEDLYAVGIIAEVMQMLRIPDGTLRVIAAGTHRIHAISFADVNEYLTARVCTADDIPADEIEAEGLARGVRTQFDHVVHAGRSIAPEALVSVASITDPSALAYSILAHLSHLPVDVRQELLEIDKVGERLERLLRLLRRESDIIDVQRQIRARVEKEIGDNQREMILREQMKAIQDELRQRDDRSGETDDYRQTIEACGMPLQASERALKEVDRLERTPFGSPEGAVIRSYLDWLIALPWSVSSEDRIVIAEAAAILEEEHHGLQKAKDRILEYLAVRQLARGALKSPILCFTGPPGVGKTSIGKSIAKALGRKFARVSLGGIRDEAEIRGHRRTYVGALPGRIMQGIRHAGVRNPVFMLDEVDKLGMDFRGDPSSALLEALDPEQNGEFSDHYIELPFDLRDVMFIATANLLDPIPPALRDRMEVIPFAGYTEEEKRTIAQRFLWPKQMVENGIANEPFTVDDAATTRMISEYTREAGVRALEREIASVCRKVARAVAEGRPGPSALTVDDVPGYLGRGRYRHEAASERDEVGAATGLVFTEVGGDIVTVEVSLIDGNEPRLTLTGQLGEVMRESAQAALTCIRSRAHSLGIDPTFNGRLDVHVHVPSGGIPKDGPSAGITIATALASAATGRPVSSSVAMTGEVTLRGRILPVGGVREKILGAHRAGIRRIILPAENLRDVDDVPDNVRSEIVCEYVEHLDEALAHALAPPSSSVSPPRT